MSNMQRFMGILYCVDVDDACMTHGPDPKTLYQQQQQKHQVLVIILFILVGQEIIS